MAENPTIGSAATTTIAAAAPPTDRRWRLAAAAAVVLGCALRVQGRGVHSIWYDEGATLYLANADDPIAALAGSRHPPLAILAFRDWIHAFGRDEATVRLLPAILACVSLLLFTRLAKSWLSPRDAFFAVALYAFAPFHIRYAQEITPYAFLELGSNLVFVAFTRALQRPGNWFEPLGVGVGVALAFGSQYMGFLTGASLGALAIAAIATHGLPRRRAASLVAAAAAGGLVWIPWIWAMLPMQMGTDWGNDAKISGQIVGELPVRLILHDLSVLGPGMIWLGWLVGGIVWLGLLWFGARAAREREPNDLWIGIGFLAPIAALFVLTIALPPNFQTRYLTAASPFAALAVARGLGLVRPAGVGIVLASIAAAGTLGITILQKGENCREDYRSACAEIAERWRPGEPILVLTGTSDPFAEGAIRHYFRERPAMLASIFHAREVAATGGSRLPNGVRVHVVLRKRSYSRAQEETVAHACALVEEGPLRHDVQRRLYFRP